MNKFQYFLEIKLLKLFDFSKIGQIWTEFVRKNRIGQNKTELVRIKQNLRKFASSLSKIPPFLRKFFNRLESPSQNVVFKFFSPNKVVLFKSLYLKITLRQTGGCLVIAGGKMVDHIKPQHSMQGWTEMSIWCLCHSHNISTNMTSDFGIFGVKFLLTFWDQCHLEQIDGSNLPRNGYFRVEIFEYKQRCLKRLK